VRRFVSHESRQEAEKGFTLIELMVVVLIIAILIAIAIPTFLGARTRAQDRSTQSDLRNALTAQKTFYTDKQAYADPTDAADTASLDDIEPRLKWITSLTWVTGDVAVGSITVTNGAVCMQEQSASGKVFALADVAAGSTAATYYAQDVCPATIDGTSFAGWKKGGW
jgi:type IV pilus assembly protein PilA